MSETATFDPTDPGPVLPSYDPNWEARFDAIHARLEAHERRVASGRADARSHERAQELAGRLCAAHDAQFQYAWQYDEHLRAQHTFGAWRASLRLPDVRRDASVEEMRETYRRFGDLCSTVVHLRAFEPAREWGGGLFAEEAPRGVEREIIHEAIELRYPRDRPLHAKLIVERHGAAVHVCAIQDPRWSLPSVFAHDEFLAERLAERHLPPPRRRDALLRRPPRGRLFLYATRVPSQYGPPRQDVVPYEVVWARRGRRPQHMVELRPLRLRDATPLIRRETLTMQPELWAAVREREEVAEA